MLVSRPPDRGLAAVDGLSVGHATKLKAATGCTVILCPAGAVAGADVGGAAAGTRELDACSPHHIADRIHGVVLSGGSAFGLSAADGVTRYLGGRGVGFDTGVARVPIVPAAILFDLRLGSSRIRPDAAMGRAACQAASRGRAISGCAGAGTGATVGKLFGMERAMKSGVGSASLKLPSRAGGATVAALAAVNAFGDVRHVETGEIVAGARAASGSGPGFADTAAHMARGVSRAGFAPRQNTTLIVVGTDARLSRAEACRVARLCQDGLARAVTPAHTRFDGDIVFVLSTGKRRADPDCLAVAACRAIGHAVLDAVMSATTLHGLPAVRDLDST